MRVVVYESAELRVVAVRPHRSRSAVVTFSSYVHHRTLDRPGFGEAFLLKYGIDAVHVVCRGNEWFQYDDLRPALELAAREIGGYENRVAYGLSMGGYAAINFSDWLGVDRVIAIAPQYSITRAACGRKPAGYPTGTGSSLSTTASIAWPVRRRRPSLSMTTGSRSTARMSRRSPKRCR